MSGKATGEEVSHVNHVEVSGRNQIFLSHSVSDSSYKHLYHS